MRFSPEIMILFASAMFFEAFLGQIFVFFISFTILVSMLIMNLSVAAVIEGLDNAKKENMGIVEGDEIEILIDMW